MATSNPIAAGLGSYTQLQNMEYMKMLSKQAEIMNESKKAEENLFLLHSMGIYEPADLDSPLPGLIQFTGDTSSMPKDMLSAILQEALPTSMLKYKGVIGDKKRKQGKVNSIVRVTEENMEDLQAPREQLGNLMVILETPKGRKVPMGRTAVEGEDPQNDLFLTDAEFHSAMTVGGNTMFAKSETGRDVIGREMVARHGYDTAKMGLSGPGGGYTEQQSPGFIQRGSMVGQPVGNITPTDRASLQREQLGRYDELLRLLDNPDTPPEEARKVYAALTEINMQLGLTPMDAQIVADNEPNAAGEKKDTPKITRRFIRPGPKFKTKTERKEKTQQEEQTGPVPTYTDTINITSDLPRARSYEEAKEKQLEGATDAGTGTAQILDYDAQPRLIKDKNKWLGVHVNKAIKEAENKLDMMKANQDSPVATLPSFAPNTTAAKNIFDALGFSKKTQDITQDQWQTVYDYLQDMKTVGQPSSKTGGDPIDMVIDSNPQITDLNNTTPPVLNEKEATAMREYIEANRIKNIQDLAAHQRLLSREKRRAMNWVIAGYAADPSAAFSHLNDHLETGVSGYSYGNMMDDRISDMQMQMAGNSAARAEVSKMRTELGADLDLSYNEDLDMYVDVKSKNEEGEYETKYDLKEFATILRNNIARLKTAGPNVRNDPGVRATVHTQAARYFWGLADKYPSSVRDAFLRARSVATFDKFQDWLPAALGGHQQATWFEGLSDPADHMIVIKEGDDLRLGFTVPNTKAGGFTEINRSVDLQQLAKNQAEGKISVGLLLDMGIRVWDKNVDSAGKDLKNAPRWDGSGY